MVIYLAKRVVHLIVVLFVVTFATAFMLNLAPGNPAIAILGSGATPQSIASIDRILGFNRPWYDRYGHWLNEIVHGNFGTSYLTNIPVASSVREAVPVTLELMVFAMIMVTVIAVPLAVYTAYKADGPVDRLATWMTSILVSCPPFISALVLVYFFALHVKAFPVEGWTTLSASFSGNLRDAFLPSLTLALAEIPQFVRLLRADMIGTLQEDFIRAARAKGLSTPSILFKHALRPSSFSLITYMGLSIGRLIGGAVIVEVLFVLPGLGNLIVTAIFNKDVLVVQGVVTLVAVAYVVLNTLIDIAYQWIDPRVRVSSRD